MRRRRREGGGGTYFDIYEDPQDRQQWLEELHRQSEGRNSERFSSPSEDKENSDESLGIFDDVEMRDGVRQSGRRSQHVLIVDDEEGYEVDFDEDEDMFDDDSEEPVTSDDSGRFSDYVLGSSDSSFGSFTQYSAPATRATAIWRHSATAANRGRSF